MKSYKTKSNTIALIRGNHKMNFSKLFDEVDKVAGGLQKLGVKKGDSVILALPNIEQAVVAIYAISKIGAVAGMIHPLLAPDEFEKAISKQNPKVVFLSDINFINFAPKCKGKKIVFCPYVFYAYIGLSKTKNYIPYKATGDEDMFYMQSGGTSGVPKTVAISSKAANAMAKNLLSYLDDKFTEKQKMLTFMPMFHGFGLCVGVHAPLSTNMGVVLLPKYTNKKACKLIKKYGITTMLAVPHVINKLLKYEGFDESVLASLEDIYVGGDTVTDELVNKFEEKTKNAKSKAKLSPGYGLTESTSVCALTKGDFVSGSIGKPLNNVDMMVVDESYKELSNGEEGELLVSTEQLMSSYLNDKEATNNAFIEIDGKKWIKTGDFFKKDNEGRFYFLGRKKRLIKISGVNVFPVEIERVASELPFINECLAIEYRENGKPFIKLLVEGNITDSQKEQTIKHITKELSHWNTPSKVECIKEFPRTQIGKIDITKVEHEFK